MGGVPCALDNDVQWDEWAMILSHLIFIFPVIVSIAYGRVIQGIGFSLSIIASTLYHMCEAKVWCAWEYTTVVRMDLFFSQMTVPLVVLSLIRFKSVGTELAAVFVFMAIQFDVLIRDPYARSHSLQFIVVGTALGSLVAFWAKELAMVAWDRYQRREWLERIERVEARQGSAEARSLERGWKLPPERKFPHYNWEAFGTGIFISILAVTVFMVHDTHMVHYPLLHTAWHLGVMYGAAFLILASPPVGTTYAPTIAYRRELWHRDYPWVKWWTRLAYNGHGFTWKPAEHVDSNKLRM